MSDKQGELIAHKQAPAPADVRQPENLMGALIQAAMNPEIDADKMERMLAMYERMEATKDRRDFHEALAEMLPEIPEIGKHGVATNKDGRQLYKFAKWDEMNRLIRPILQKHGFALTFRTQEHERGVLITGVLSRGGHSETTSVLQTLESASAAMNSNQARGNAISYGKRYTAAALLNLITTEEEDNDASGASGEVLSEHQAARIRELVAELGIDEDKLLEWTASRGILGTDLDSLPFEAFETIEKQLKHWIAKRAK